MNKIKQLPLHESQKIAAGQVIDRPANVVKELIENSIDAGATHITITIEDGGKKLIRVTDNGYGMNADDAQLCFAKHATSKITSVDQLASITTFGFRGEALASIAAVGKVTLLTKLHGALEGTEVHTQDSMITHSASVACPEGTDIAIHNIFYNMPARQKFIKTRETETRHIVQTVQAISLAYPELSIKLIVDGKPSITCPSQESIIERCAQLWDHATAKNMIPLVEIKQEKGVSIIGAISNHHWFRYDRSGIFFLVNNRWVTNPHLIRALIKGYDNVIPHGRCPMACISIMINPALIDINMHPRKEEIKFAHPRIVEQLISQTVRHTLEKNLSSQIKRDVRFAPLESHVLIPSPHQSLIRYSPTQKLASWPENQFNTSNDNPFLDDAMPSDINAETQEHDLYTQEHNAFTFDIKKPSPTTTELNMQPQNNSMLPQISILENDADAYQLIGQLHKTYLLIEQGDGLYVIDQHAAHERILYELFETRFTDIPTINLMFPQLITCNPDEMATIEPHLHLFAHNGIMIEPFGKDQLIIQATPVHLKDMSLHELIKQVISWIQEYNALDHDVFVKSMHNKLRAQMACKAAVKAGDVLTRSQMEELLTDLYKTPNRFNCPHGRPTGWLLSLDEIEKKFRRKT